MGSTRGARARRDERRGEGPALRRADRQRAPDGGGKDQAPDGDLIRIPG